MVIRRNKEGYCRRLQAVTNIVNEFTNDLESSDYESMRELVVQLKKEGMTFAQLVSIFRPHNYVNKLGANEEQIELLIENLLVGARSLPPEKIVDLLDMLFELSKSESIPLTEVPAFVKQKIEEKKRLEEEIQKAAAILEEKNIDIKTIEGFKRLKDELKKCGLSSEAPHKLVSVTQSFSEMGYDPQKIVTYYAHIKSLRQTVRGLSKECRIWESRAMQYRQVIPLCQQITRLGIGIEELIHIIVPMRMVYRWLPRHIV